MSKVTRCVNFVLNNFCALKKFSALRSDIHHVKYSVCTTEHRSLYQFQKIYSATLKLQAGKRQDTQTYEEVIRHILANVVVKA